jgi:tetratricopeptide (TPR) repeat protein
MTSNDSRQLHQQAKKLFEQGNLQESQTAFRKLVESGDLEAEGFYGLGLISFRMQDLSTAAKHFQSCAKLDPRNANAFYYLGEISRLQGSPNDAHSQYRRALEIMPTHSGALQKLSIAAPRIPENSAPPLDLPRPPAINDPIPRLSQQPLGAYELIRNDPSQIARQAIALIDATRISEPLHLSAFMGKFLARAFLPLILLVAILILPTRGKVSQLVLLAFLTVLVICILAELFLILKIKTTRVILDQGRLQISKGIFSKEVENVELYRVTDLELHRSFLHRLTGDGTITLFVEASEGRRMPKPIGLTGLAKIDRLEVLFNQLRNLIFVMRSGQWGKGIIY